MYLFFSPNLDISLFGFIIIQQQKKIKNEVTLQ